MNELNINRSDKFEVLNLHGLDTVLKYILIQEYNGILQISDFDLHKYVRARLKLEIVDDTYYDEKLNQIIYCKALRISVEQSNDKVEE